MILSVNAHGLPWLGYTREDLLGQPVAMHGESVAAV